MKQNFERILAFTHAYEGGWSDNPHEPGGATSHGVTLATYCHETGRRMSFSDLRNIPMTTVSSIYRKKFWNVVNGDALESGVDLYGFELSVNNGPGEADRFLSMTAHLRGVERIHALDRLRLGFWRHLVREWPFFRKGWCARENACLKLALQMAK